MVLLLLKWINGFNQNKVRGSNLAMGQFLSFFHRKVRSDSCDVS